MFRYIDSLIVYRKSAQNNILEKMGEIFRTFDDGDYERRKLVDEIYTQINLLLDIATDYGFDDNLWRDYIAYLLATSENPFTITCEKTQATDGTVNEFVKNDLVAFHNILDFDFYEIESELGIDCFTRITHYKSLVKPERRFNKCVSDSVRYLSDKLKDTSGPDELYEVVTDFYRERGVGSLGLNKAFRVEHVDGCNGVLTDQLVSGSDRMGASFDRVVLSPITNTSDAVLGDIIGYEIQKKKLIENTEAFLDGKKANNVLLFGDSGTGKSTCIKAVLNEYFDRGLRMIEIYKHQFTDLSAVLSIIKNRNYKFIIFMDDLSFEEFETEYKYLKAVIEGGLENKPDNVLIYATSNRRHIIRESWKDRADMDDELHSSDTMQEKLSLAARFGLAIYYGRPGKKEYEEIVKGIAARYPDLGVSEEELLLEANRWSLRSGGFSGRTAEQMITSLLGR